MAYVLLLFLVISASPFILPKLFGYEPYGILSDSMEPEYPVGSLVYVKEEKALNIEKGDVITFYLGVGNQNVATHRVVMNDTKREEFMTKGDHNEDVDATGVAYSRVIGTVRTCIPWMGSYYLWLVSVSGIAVCTFLFFMVILLWVMVSKWKKELD